MATVYFYCKYNIIY